MRIATILLLIGAAFAPVVAQEKKAEEKKDTPPVKQTGIKIASVVGMAQKLVPGAKGEKDKWVALKAGETVQEHTIIRTGLKKTKVVIRFPDGSEFTIDRATKIGIGQFRKTGNDVKAKLGLKYGAVRAQIEKGTGKTEYDISTPVATLSVRGSISKFGFTIDSGLGLLVENGFWDVREPKDPKNPDGFTKAKTFTPGEYSNGPKMPAIIVYLLRRHSNIADLFGLTRKDRLFQLKYGRGRGLIGLPGGRNTQGSTRLFKQSSDSGSDPDPDPESESESESNLNNGERYMDNAS